MLYIHRDLVTTIWLMAASTQQQITCKETRTQRWTTNSRYWKDLKIYKQQFLQRQGGLVLLWYSLRCHIIVWKCYKNEHIFEICHWTWSSKLSCKILRWYDLPISRKWRLKLPFLVIFRIFPNQNCPYAVAYGRPDVTLWGCTSCRVTILVRFVSVKPEARRSFR